MSKLAVKERPILFSGPMARAILEDRKTQTRRIVKGLPEGHGVCACGYSGGWAVELPDGACSCRPVSCPYGKPGDRLWVRETFRGWCQVNGPHEPTRYGVPYYVPDQQNCTRLEYRATFDGEDDNRWRPATNMPRWASRILLEVTAVRVERLQDISEEDAIAEGLFNEPIGGRDAWGWAPLKQGFKRDPFLLNRWSTPLNAYRALWESVNGPGSWDASPWVWVVEFKRVESEATQ